MKRFLLSLILGTVVCIDATAQQGESALSATRQDKPPETLVEKASYLIGYNIVKDLKIQEIDFELAQLIKGIRDATAGERPPMTDEEIQSVMIAFQKLVQQQQQERLAKIADNNMRQGAAFLKENLLAEGIVELENGLQYKVIKNGAGATPRITDSVKVHYKAMFLDGTVFETTAAGAPVAFTVGGGMRGITNALQQMKVGDKWKLFIPSDLAFGVQGDPPVVGPNQVLMYELELVEIIK